MPRHSLLIQRFPYGGREDTECVDWLIRTYHQAKLDRRFDRVACDSINDTPITMTRNQALANGVRLGFDFMLMVDSDMSPDAELRAGDPTAKPFFDVAVEHALASAKPCLIAAPYVGPPPLENIYVFQWANRGNTLHPEAANARMEQFTREEAARLQGIQAVGALPTGLMLIDLRCLAKLPQPWTYYEYHAAGEECEACHQRVRGPEERKASTEDVTFSRDLGLLGFGVFCAWDSWAGHNKRYTARKPRPYTTDIVAGRFRKALAAGFHSSDAKIDVKPADWMAEEIARADAVAAAIPAHTGWQEFTGYDAGRPRGWAAEQNPAHPLHQPPAPASLDQTATINLPEFLRPERGVVQSAPLFEAALPGLLADAAQVVAAVPQVVFDGVPLAQPAPNRPWEDHIPPPNPEPERPWNQHGPAAVGEPLTPGDLLSGVPLG
jgi:hypothetical protein